MRQPSLLNRPDSRMYRPLLHLVTASAIISRGRIKVSVSMHRTRRIVMIHAVLLFAAIVAVLPAPCLAVEFLARTADEISFALRKASPGDTVVLINGVWTDQYIRFEGEGTELAPLVLRAQTPGQVLLTGNSRLDISGHWLVADGLRFEDGALESGQHVIRFTGKKGEAANSRLTNVAIVNYNPKDPSTRYFWVSLFGQNNRLDHSRFEGQNHSGVTVVVWRKSGVRDGHIIEYNHFLNRAPGDGNGFETIRIGTSDSESSDSGTVVQYNLFERTNGEIEIISVKSGDNDIRANTFRQAAGTVTLRRGDGNRVTGNFFLGDHADGSGGIRVMGSGHLIVNNYLQNLAGRTGAGIVFSCGHADNRPAGNSPVTNVVVAHNTLVHNSKAAFKLDAGCGTQDRTVRPVNVQIWNNLVSDQDGPLFDGLTGAGAVLAGNLFSGKDTSDLIQAGVVVIDQQLKLAPDDLWRPGLDSPARNAGVATGIVLPDMDGQERDRAPDIGADEYSLASVVNKPLSARDVGPNWIK